MLHQRHYTAAQANALLPEVRLTVRRLQDAPAPLEQRPGREGFSDGLQFRARIRHVVSGAGRRPHDPGEADGMPKSVGAIPHVRASARLLSGWPVSC